MSEMVEKVARAICADLGLDADARHLALDETEFRGWNQFENAAKAAIEAMREPTEALR